MFCPNPDCLDFKEDGVHGEYLETVAMCPKCGAELVPELPQEGTRWHVATAETEPAEVAGATLAYATPTPAGPLVAVAAFDFAEESERLMSLLAENGVAAFQFYDDGRDFEDPAGVAPCTRVLVAESQAAFAMSLLEQGENEP